MTQRDTDPAAIRARVEAVLEGLRRVNLQVMVVARPDATRLAARDRARAMAIDAGRLDVFDEAAAAAREATLRSFANAGFSGTWAATEMSASVASADDGIAAAAAFEEAAMAAVVEDVADDETLEVLRATSDELGRSAGIAAPGSLATFTARSGLTTKGPLQVAGLITLLVLCAVAWVTVGTPFALVVFALGVLVVAKLGSARTGTDA